jgi:hypothetical protein
MTGTCPCLVRPSLLCVWRCNYSTYWRGTLQIGAASLPLRVMTGGALFLRAPSIWNLCTLGCESGSLCSLVTDNAGVNGAVVVGGFR